MVESAETGELIMHFKMPNEIGRSYDGRMLDITGAGVIQVEVSSDKSVLWINVDGVCVLRVCRVEGDILGIKGER